MAILAFQKPENVVKVEVPQYVLDECEPYELVGRFEFKPLEPGYAKTIGNALRRILLSSLEGYAIASIRIHGVEHEFATIPGVTEDVTNIILNLKKIRFKQKVDNADEEVVTVAFPANKDVFTAEDLNAALSNFEITNLDQHICSFDPQVASNVKIEFRINKGRGYVPSDENAREGDPLNTIAIDSIYTPIRRVMPKEESFRVEQKTDYEMLVIDVETDGSINPKDALKEAAKILIHHFMLFSDEKITLIPEEKEESEEFDEDSLHLRQLLKTKLVDLDLSVRALNCLKAAEVETLGDLVAFTKPDLLKFRNFGKKSLTELDELIKSKGLEFGMNVSKYKLDKE